MNLNFNFSIFSNYRLLLSIIFLFLLSPGSGKTSFIVALAGELDYNICILSLSDEGMTDDRLAQALSVVPQRSIVLLEDIDAAFGSRLTGADAGGASRHRRSSLTFSGLLNTLDGVASSEERIIFMTTNYLERLDPALMRPGRVDSVHRLGSATRSQARRLFESFYTGSVSESDVVGMEEEMGTEEEMATDKKEVQPLFASVVGIASSEELAELAVVFATKVDEMVGVNPSMAELQGHLLGYKENPALAVKEISMLEESLMERESRVALQEEEARRLEIMAGFAGNGIGSRGEDDGGGGGTGSGRRVTSDQVEKMAFNPQPGWEEAVGLK